ncbi:MAG: Por secretion system protein, partial [Salinivirgaceae bacterium]|nr:Por secretion system protein [Salinivirgaceae bacterium]
MARFLIVTIALLTALTARAQIVGESWRDHLSYNNCKAVAVADGEVYCASSSSLFSYSKSDGRVRHLTTIEGLSDMGVGSIAYSDEASRLVIGYSNGNIDLMDDDGRVYNLSGLKDKSMSTSKNINHIGFDGSKAYLSCDFGLTTIDIKRREFVDTYILRAGGRQI